MAYFIYDTQANAVEASRQRWLGVLGHAKKPEDITTYAWPVWVGLDGRTACDASQFPTAVPPSTGYLGPAATLDPANWPPPSGPA